MSLHVTSVFVYCLAWLPRVQYIMGSSLGRVKPNYVKFVFTAFPLSTCKP